MSGAGIGMTIALQNVRGGRGGRGVGSGEGMMGEGGKKGVVRDQGMAIEGWREGGGEGKVVEGDHTEHVQMSQRSSRHDG